MEGSVPRHPQSLEPIALQHFFGGDMNVIAGDTKRMKEGCERLFHGFISICILFIFI